MNATAVADTTDGMPARDPVMSPAELRALIEAAGLGEATKSEVAQVLGVARSHLYRWLKGAPKGTNINAATALLIRSKLKPKRKKK